VAGFLGVARGVLVGGAIAATDVAAGQADAQVHPLVARAQAVLAAHGVRPDLQQLIDMDAVGGALEFAGLHAADGIVDDGGVVHMLSPLLVTGSLFDNRVASGDNFHNGTRLYLYVVGCQTRF